MRRFSKTSAIPGWLAVAAMLALSSPGVSVVRAADDLAVEAGEAAVCEAGTVRGARDVPTHLQEIQRRRAEQEFTPRSDDETIVLNNRGFNYDKAGFDFPRAREPEGR